MKSISATNQFSIKQKTGIPSYSTSGVKKGREQIRVYAIAFDMDIESLKQSYGDPYNNAYGEIRRVLGSHGFSPQQGSVYFGNENINAVTCVLAVQDLAQKFPWFVASVRDIRMLRIEEFNDLLPAIQSPGA